MASKTLIAKLTSDGHIDTARVTLANDTQEMGDSGDGFSATFTVEVADFLDILFECEAISGTDFKCTVEVDGKAPFFSKSGTTEGGVGEVDATVPFP